MGRARNNSWSLACVRWTNGDALLDVFVLLYGDKR